MKTKHYENNGICTRIDYRFIGYGIDAQQVFCKIITLFSVEKGIISRFSIIPNCFCR